MVRNRPLLTIAIPTYNRSALLAVGLEHVASQIAVNPELAGKVDLLVVDNASTDDTEELVSRLQGRYSFLHYRKNERNYGIDGNIYRCTLHARGEYVHLLSDDDVLLPGGVQAVVEHIEHRPDVKFFFVNIRAFAGHYDSSRLGPPVFPNKGDLFFNDPADFISYCWVYLTFVSSFVLHRDTWFVSQNHESYVGTDIYLSFALFDHLAHSPVMCFVAEPVIAIRAHYSGNYRMFYAFAYQWRRLLLDHAPSLGFNRRQMEQTFRRSIRDDLLPRVINFRVNHQELDVASRKLVFENTRDFAAAWYRLYPFVYMPRALLKGLYRVAKPLQSLWSGAGR